MRRSGGRWLDRRSTVMIAVVCLLGLTLQATPVRASVSFTSAWGWQVAGGEETCTSATGCIGGSQGAGAGQFTTAFGQGIAIDSSSGNVYVASASNERIDVFSSSGVFVKAWGWGVSDGESQLETCTTSCESGLGGGGAGQLSVPLGVAVDAAGNVYVADDDNNRIDEFSPGSGTSDATFERAWGWGVVDGESQLETCTTATGCEAGDAGGNAGEVDHPQAVALDVTSGNIYVADYGNERVDQFSPGSVTSAATFDQAWGWGVADGGSQLENCTTATGCQAGAAGGGAGQLDYPAGLAVGDSENVYVADDQNNRIDEFSSSGGFLRAWGWGVVDGSNQFETCTATTGCRAGIAGGGAGEMFHPRGVALDAGSGNLYVADGYQRIDDFSSSGSFIKAWGWGVSDGSQALETCSSSCRGGLNGGGAGQMFENSGVAVDGPGDVYVADSGNARIDEFSPGAGTSDAGFVNAWGWGVLPGPETCAASCEPGLLGGGAGQLYFGNGEGGGAAVASNGDVYVADGGNNRIDEFSTSGSFMEAWGWGVQDGGHRLESCTTVCRQGIYGGGAGQLTLPLGVALDGAGDVYVADWGNNRIDEFSSSGSFIRAWGWGVSDGGNQFEVCTTSCQAGLADSDAGGLDLPTSVAIDPTSGNVYVVDSANNRIAEYSSTGSFIRAWGWGVVDGQSKLEVCTTSTGCALAQYGGGAGELYVGDVFGDDGYSGGISVDASGDVYVADAFNNRVDEFTASGGFVKSWGWGVSDGTTPALQTCTATCHSGLAAGGAGGLHWAAGLSVDSNGDVYVADEINNRVDEFTPGSGASAAGFDGAWGWGVRDGAGGFETCTASTGCQQGLNGGGSGEMDFPESVAADSPTTVYVVDDDNNRIDEFEGLPSWSPVVGAVRVRRASGDIVVSWRVARNAGIAGFNVFAGHHRLNRRVIAVHHGRNYRFRTRWMGKGPYALQVLLRDGRRIAVRA